MPTSEKAHTDYLSNPSIQQKRKLAVYMPVLLDKSATANLTKCLLKTTESHSFLHKTTPTELIEEVEKINAELILMTSPDWQPSVKGIEDLLLGYEMGACITAGKRPKEFQSPTSMMVLQKLFLYVFFGNKQQDPDTPVRLYTKESFLHVLGVLENYQNTFPEDLYIVSAIEHYFKFTTTEVPTTSWKEKPPHPQLDFLKMIGVAGNIKDAIRTYRAQNFS